MIKILKNNYFLLAILLFGFLLRVYKFESPLADWHSFRQVDTASVTREYMQKPINILFPTYHDISTTQSGLFNPNGYRFVEVPIYSVLHATLLSYFPFFSLEEWGRLISIFASLGTIYLTYLIVKRTTNKHIATLSLIIYSLLPFSIFYSRVILPEPLALLFAMLSLYQAIIYSSSKSKKITNLLLMSLFMSVSILIKPYTLYFGLPIAFLFLKDKNIKNLLLDKNIIISVFVILTPLIFWRMWIKNYPEGIPFWKWTFNGDGIRFKPAFWYWIFGERIANLILGFWMAVPFVQGLIKSYKDYKFIFYYFIGAIFYTLIFATANVRHDYYQIIIVPSLIPLVAVGFYEFKNQFNSNLKFSIFISVILVISLFSSAFRIKEYYKINRPEIIYAGLVAQQYTNSSDLLIAPYNGDTAFLYQTKRRGWPVVDRPITQMIQNNAHYFISVDLDHPQTRQFESEYKTIFKDDKVILLDLFTAI